MRIDPTWHEEPACAFLIREGGNPKDYRDRVAFIQKTPRIRIRMATDDNLRYDHLNWAEAGFRGNNSSYPPSRRWCEDALRLFGHEIG